MIRQEHGYVISVIIFFVLIIMVTLAVSMGALASARQHASTNAISSTKSYYAAESGIEDALMRLSSNHQMASTSYTLTVGTTTANVTIPAIIGGSRAITSKGNSGVISRKIQAVYAVDSQTASFHYAVQIGPGGLSMGSGSQVQGNIFADGNISGSGTITNDVIVAGAGNKLNGPHVNGNTLAPSCSSSTIDGNLTYVTGGTNSCTVHGTTNTQSNPIDIQPMPISQSQIDDWKAEAAAGTVISGNYSVSGTQSLGPVKITGNLTVNNGATLKITGTTYIVGTITLNNNSTVKLDSSYGPLGGIFMTDGIININNNVILAGSGQTQSHLLVISNSNSDTAIVISNNANGAQFYTSAGGIQISNNAIIKEVTGYKVILNNNVTVQYDGGLENAFFSSGPSGGWKVTSWGEK
jgi:Tfp pilus assembly protein PilX